MKNAILIFLLFFISCNEYNQNPKQEKPEQKRVLSPISSWLVQNEDTLFNFFKDSTRLPKDKGNRGKQDWTEYVFEGGTMGTLSEKIHELTNCINVYYLYNPSQNPYFGILLTSDFDTSCSTMKIDSVFSDIDNLKHFILVKYRFPGRLFSGFINGRDTLDQSDISFKIIPNGERFDLIMYSKRKYSYDTNELLKEQIFGEEVFLKKINSIKIQSPPDTTQNLKTIEEIRSFFKIKDID